MKPLVHFDLQEDILLLGYPDKLLVLSQRLDHWLRHYDVQAALHGLLADNMAPC